MLKPRISAAAIAAFLLLPAMAGCLMAVNAQAQTMDCCAQTDCTHGNQMQTCFSTAAPAGSLQSALELRVSLSPPLLIAVTIPPAADAETSDWGQPASAAPQHSPPDLYTLYSTLLI